MVRVWQLRHKHSLVFALSGVCQRGRGPRRVWPWPCLGTSPVTFTVNMAIRGALISLCDWAGGNNKTGLPRSCVDLEQKAFSRRQSSVFLVGLSGWFGYVDIEYGLSYNHTSIAKSNRYDILAANELWPSEHRFEAQVLAGVDMSPSSSMGGGSTRAYSISGVLFLFAIVLAFQPFRFSSPVPAATPVPSWATNPATVRHPDAKPEYHQAVFTYRCSACHDIIPSPLKTNRTLTQHSEIELEHGINASCFSCHHRTNRDAFVDDLGGEIPWDQPELMCAKCHGPVFRDWQHGVHGRTNGFWLKTKGPQTRRKCTECHDPHRPPFPPMHPAPGPSTLRMGRQDYGKHPANRNPLQILQLPDDHPGTGKKMED